MVKLRSKGEIARKIILKSVEKHPTEVVVVAAQALGISRQAVNKHLQNLVKEGVVQSEGKTRQRRYRLAPLLAWSHTYAIVPDIAEDIVWRNDIAPHLGKLPHNVLEIWRYAFTEMFNNAIDHSEGRHIKVWLEKNTTSTEIVIADDGIGIFKKIKEHLNLLDERHAVLELSKGKLTTDPSKHTGQGIFFSSRMFDHFAIFSGATYFSHTFDKVEDWILESEKNNAGTYVVMKLDNHTARRARKIFDKFSSNEADAFNKTIVPVRLAQYGDENLISRSQAKRLLARVDRFRVVLLDFTEVKMIGQAFADEIFRVFVNEHPDITLTPINTNREVSQMIKRAQENT